MPWPVFGFFILQQQEEREEKRRRAQQARQSGERRARVAIGDESGGMSRSHVRPRRAR